MSSELQTETVATPLTLSLQPIGASASLRDQAYAMLRQAIADADIYQNREAIRLDERVLSESLGVSRTRADVTGSSDLFGRALSEGHVTGAPGVFAVHPRW